MSGAKGPMHQYGRTPAKGTKARASLILMLRTQGASAEELVGILGSRNSAMALIRVCIDQKGWDIRWFPDRKQPSPRRGAPCGRYKVVGRSRWDGSYRDLTRIIPADPSLGPSTNGTVGLTRSAST